MSATRRATLLVALLAIGVSARAQDGGTGFLFKEPSWSLAIRGGFAMPTAGSDLFALATSQFTLNRSDFRSLDGSAELAFRVKSRLDLVFGAAISGMSKASESRGWKGSDNLPIAQTTNFRRMPVSLSARYYLQPRGRTIGHFAWVPASYAAYVGAGVGMTNYDFDQSGEFVDSTTKKILPGDLHSGGWAPMAQALAGIDWSIGPRWALTTEAKYVTASASLDPKDFSGFHRLDLSGFSTSIGFYVRF